LQSINISYQLFSQFCNCHLHTQCLHEGNEKRMCIHSCCYNYCPVVMEAKRQELRNNFNHSLQQPLPARAEAATSEADVG
jgi:hypothetical protein